MKNWRYRTAGQRAFGMLVLGVALSGAAGCEEGTESTTAGSAGQGGSTSSAAGGGGTAGSSTAGAGGAGAGGMSTGGTSTGGMSTGGTGTGGTGGGPPIPPSCRLPCGSAADCAAPGQPAFDQDNYTCTATKCEYKGCNSAQECIDTYKNPGYKCEQYPGGGAKSCHLPCGSVADCAIPGQPAFDQDNYTCDAGFCNYKGCNSAQECIDTYKNPGYKCEQYPGGGAKSCHLPCGSVADCTIPGQPAFDQDNYTCDAGFCNYKGCNSAQECIDTYKNPDYVCD